MFRFISGLAFALALLVGLGYVIGHGASSGEPLHALTSAAGRTGISVALATPLLILAGWCLRRLWLQYLAWSPGTIQVPEFTTACEQKPPTAQLTTQFRNTLATLRLQTDSPSPGAQPPSDFLDVLSKDSALQGATANSAVAQVAAFLRASFPPAALEVRGTLITREDASGLCCGVSLQVVRLPNQGSLLNDVWEKTWEAAIRRAADGAIAAILPRTRRCKGPWATWRGYVMDAHLLSAYEDAARLESERRYFAALRCCYRALERDPLNLAIRLQLGKLQEQLGLYLEALGTYESILISGQPGDRGLPRRLYSLRARRERERQSHIARYRQIVLLSGNSIVKEWRQVRHDLPQESKYRHEMETLLRRFCDSLDLSTCKPRQLHCALCSRASEEAAGLKRKIRWWRLTHLEANPHLLTRTIAVTEACIDERRAILTTGPSGRCAKPIAVQIQEMDRRLRKCARWKGLHTFQSNYSAACLYALPLKRTYSSIMSWSEAERKQLAERAIGQLQVAASFADSAFLGTRSHWLITEDPDLDGLRRQPEFETFVSIYFPSALTTPHRWAERKLVALYTYELLRSASAAPVAGWRERADKDRDGLDGRALSEWWRHESDLWRLMSSVAANPIDWRSHVSLLDTIDLWNGNFSTPSFHCSAPEAQERERVIDRLKQLGEVLSGASSLVPATGAVDPKPVWLAEHAYTLSVEDFARVCSYRAEMWSRMNAFLGGAEEDVSELDERFRAAIADVERAESPWRAQSPRVAAA